MLIVKVIKRFHHTHSKINLTGFSESDIVVDELDNMENKMEIINYAYCKHSQMKTVPQVFINKQVGQCAPLAL